MGITTTFAEAGVCETTASSASSGAPEAKARIVVKTPQKIRITGYLYRLNMEGASLHGMEDWTKFPMTWERGAKFHEEKSFSSRVWALSGVLLFEREKSQLEGYPASERNIKP
jgi:hypothetical protein